MLLLFLHRRSADENTLPLELYKPKDSIAPNPKAHNCEIATGMKMYSGILLLDDGASMYL